MELYYMLLLFSLRR